MIFLPSSASEAYVFCFKFNEIECHCQNIEIFDVVTCRRDELRLYPLDLQGFPERIIELQGTHWSTADYSRPGECLAKV